MEAIGQAIFLLVAGNDLHDTRRCQHECLQFAKRHQVVQRDQPEEALILRKREVLIQGFGRAKNFLDAALDWREPWIQRVEEDALAAVRGILWRYVIA